ncbi:spermatogenesis-defective protein 39 homolog isoform X5 [Phycodurus eques]|uniref:spermatogenesis-defective protein 39 homolog isoform X5 n=1 Tax=Phycodurus eques TaxID=693459 RepID=UPI002ACE0503|nr:spermatogenesis-defective protein 39 homolog isoform X5 [Phycodurus eques]
MNFVDGGLFFSGFNFPEEKFEQRGSVRRAGVEADGAATSFRLLERKRRRRAAGGPLQSSRTRRGCGGNSITRYDKLLHYKEHLSITDEKKKRDFLKSCLSLQFSPEDQVQLRDQVSLLERQMLIEATDRQAELGGKAEIFQKFPRRASILHMPLVTTLYYCCFYHYGQPEVRSARPRSSRVRRKVPTCRSRAGPSAGELQQPAEPPERFQDLGEAVLRDGAERSGQAEVVARRGRAVRQPQLARLHQEEIAARLPSRRRHPAQKLRPRARAAGVRGPGGRRRRQDGAGPQAQMSRPRHRHVSRLQRPTAVARIPREGGGGVGGREEDRRPARQLGEEDEEELSVSVFVQMFSSFSKSAGRIDWQLVLPRVNGGPRPATELSAHSVDLVAIKRT